MGSVKACAAPVGDGAAALKGRQSNLTAIKGPVSRETAHARDESWMPRVLVIIWDGLGECPLSAV